jgi:hypothetical protein
MLGFDHRTIVDDPPVGPRGLVLGRSGMWFGSAAGVGP